MADKKRSFKIREWKDGENLESLAVGDVAGFCNTSAEHDVNFPGLYDGRDGKNFIVYSRGFERGSKDIIIWRLDGRGHVAGRLFLFDSAPQRPPKVLPAQEGGENYQALNEALERNGF